MKRSKNFYLFRIWSIINGGGSLQDVQSDLGFSKQKLNYYMKDLRTLSYLVKVGYGVWEIDKEYDEKEVKKYLQEVKKTTVIGSDQLEEVKKIKEIRGHAFQIKLLLPENYTNWENRSKVFEMIGLDTDVLSVGGVERGQQVIINDNKVHLYNKSIVVNLSESFLFKTAKESKSYALLDFFKIIKKLERMFNGSPLSHFGKYKFKVTRQHYAIIKNALAKQYISEDKKLECYTGRGLWLLVDNSFKLEELETVHPDTAEEDNEKVHEVFNNIKKEDVGVLKEMTHGNIKNALESNTSQIADLKGVFPAMEEYNKNLKLHITVQEAQLKTQIETQELLKSMGKFFKK